MDIFLWDLVKLPAGLSGMGRMVGKPTGNVGKRLVLV